MKGELLVEVGHEGKHSISRSLGSSHVDRLSMGLLSTSLLFDVLFPITERLRWADIAFWLISIWILSAILAASFGIWDWLAIPSGTRAKRSGFTHGLANILAVGLYAGSWLLRVDSNHAPETLAIALAVVALGLAGVGGWLGGELVERLGIGVHPGAHADAPNSLSGRSPTENRAG